MAQVAVCSQINTKHTNTVWAERTVVECQTVGAPRNQNTVYPPVNQDQSEIPYRLLRA